MNKFETEIELLTENIPQEFINEIDGKVDGIMMNVTSDDELLFIAKQFNLLESNKRTFAHLCYEERGLNEVYCRYCEAFVCINSTDRLSTIMMSHYNDCWNFERKKDLLRLLLREQMLNMYMNPNDIYKDIIHMINNNCLPLIIYDSPEFRELIKKHLNVDLMSLSSFTKLYYKVLEDENRIMAREFCKGDILAISVALDLWSIQRGSLSYLGVALASIDENFQWKTAKVAVKYLDERHTDHYVREMVQGALREYTGNLIDDVVEMHTTDGGLLNAFAGLYCNCHATQRSLELALKIRLLDQLCVQCYDLEGVFRHCNVDVWRDYVNICKELELYPFKLIEKSPTRYDNLCKVLEIILKQYEPIRIYIKNSLVVDYFIEALERQLECTFDEYADMMISHYLPTKEAITGLLEVLSTIERMNSMFSISSKPMIHEVLCEYILMRDKLIHVLECEVGLTIDTTTTSFLPRINERTHTSPSGKTILDSFELWFREVEDGMIEEVEFGEIEENGMIEEPKESITQVKPFVVTVKKTSVAIDKEDENEIEESPCSLLIMRFLGLLDYRIHDIFFDPHYLIPLVINPKCFGTVIGHNEYGFYMLEQFMKLIPAKMHVPKTSRKVHPLEPVKNVKICYTTMEPPGFNINNFDDICETLKKQKVIVRSGQSVAYELNRLWTSCSSCDDILDFYRMNEVQLPRVSIIARIFLVNFSSESICERMFSESGCILTKRRNRLSSDHLETMALNKMNNN